MTPVTFDWPKTAEASERIAGRASASASKARSRQRSARRIMSSIRIRRWFCSMAFWRNRIAAHVTLRNFRRFSRWMMIGTETAARPASMMGLRKLILVALLLVILLLLLISKSQAPRGEE